MESISSSSTSSVCLVLANPVPAGINLPTTTFSFNPLRLSLLPVVAASVNTLVVSWNEAAETKESVAKEALVIPRRSLLYFICCFFLDLRSLFTTLILESSTCSPIRKS